MNKILISFTVGLLSIFLTSCDNGYNHHHCNRLSCLPKNAKLSLSDDDHFLVSDSGEQFFLQNGQPTKGISCRQLIQYHVSISGQIIDISN